MRAMKARQRALGHQRRRPSDVALLLVDGLQSEREQGITIDVAHRYFDTARRSSSADTPGHEQYIARNMATSVPTATGGAVLLLDQSRGPRLQTLRHRLHRAPDGRAAVRGRGSTRWTWTRHDQAVFGAHRSRTSRAAAGQRPACAHEAHFVPMADSAAANNARQPPAARPCPGTRVRRCWSCSRTLDASQPEAPSCACRCGRRARPTSTSVATPASRSPAAPRQVGAQQRWRCSGVRSRVTSIGTAQWRARTGRGRRESR